MSGLVIHVRSFGRVGLVAGTLLLVTLLSSLLSPPAMGQGGDTRIFVTTEAELQAAVQAANLELTGTHEIELANDIILSSRLTFDSPATIVLDGNDHTLRVHVDPRYDAVRITSGSTVVWRNILFRGDGQVRQKTIWNTGGSLTLQHCLMWGHASLPNGGVVYSEGGQLTINYGSFENNLASYYQGSKGGAIYAEGTNTTIQGTEFRGNLADKGGAIYHRVGLLTVNGAKFYDNGRAAIWFDSNRVAHNNKVQFYLTDTIIERSYGTALVNVAGYGHLKDVTIANNFGAGILSRDLNFVYRGSLRIDNSTIASNRGNGISKGMYDGITIRWSTIANNIGLRGGGIYTEPKTIYEGIPGGLFVIGSTIANNYASDLGGGIYVGGGGTNGRISASISSTTFMDNTAGNGGGAIYNDGNLTVGNAIVWGENACQNSETAIVTDNGYNLVGTGPHSCGLAEGATNMVGLSPDLLPLGEYGGPTLTYLPRSTSPVIDAGPLACGADQRGNTRPVGSSCDIGSVERQPVEEEPPEVEPPDPSKCDAADPDLQPLMLIHGWGAPDELSGDDMGFKHLKEPLKGLGWIEGCNLFYAKGVVDEGIGSDFRDRNRKAISDSLQVAYYIVKRWNPDWRGHFDIIGHSYGGLNARFYLESDYYVADQEFWKTENGFGIQIDNLYTLGSPHGGTRPIPELYPAALFILFSHWEPTEWTSAALLLDSMMLGYNLASRQPDDVCYRLIGGDFMAQEMIENKSPVIFTAYFLYGAYMMAQNPLYVLSLPNDIGVSIRSSLNLSESLEIRASGRYANTVAHRTTDMHGYKRLLGLENVYSYVNPSTTFDTYIKGIGHNPASSLGENLARCTQGQTSRDSIEVQQSGVSETSEQVAAAQIQIGMETLTPGQTKLLEHPIDWRGSSAFYVTANTESLEVRLRDPNGNVLTAPAAETDLTFDYGELNGNGSSLVIYTLSDASPGLWELSITNNGAEDTLVRAYVVPSPGAGLYLQLQAPDQVTSGAPALLTATFTDGSVPVAGATLTAEVYRPDAAPVSIGLNDNGLDGDVSANDGIYSGSYVDTTTQGMYWVVASATGSTGTVPYVRTAEAAFLVAPTWASLLSVLDEQAIDDNADSLYEFLDVVLTLSATEEGKPVKVSASLRGPNGEFVDAASTLLTTRLGPQTVTLRFDGEVIRMAGVDGPYTVAEITLMDDDFFSTMDHLGDYTTEAYQFTDFGLPVPPDVPFNPSPDDGSTGVSPDTALSWHGGDDNLYESVSFEVRLGQDNPPAAVVTGHSSNSYSPASELMPSTTYYWQVVAEDTAGNVVEGPVWSFTTASSSGAMVEPVIAEPLICDSGTVDIQIDDVEGLYGYEFIVDYDETLVKATGSFDNTWFDPSNNGFSTPGWNATCNDTTGECKFAFSRGNPDGEIATSVPETIASINFTTNPPNAAGSFVVTVKDVSLTDKDSFEIPGAVGGTLNVDVCGEATVSGKISLQGRPQPGRPVISEGPAFFTVQLTGGYGPYTGVVSTTDGSYTITGVKYDVGGTNYTLSADHSVYLRAEKSLLVDGNKTGQSTTLLGGDANDDGTVELLDLSCIGGQFGATGPALTCSGAATTPDVNNDFKVNIQDLSLAAGNYLMPEPQGW